MNLVIADAEELRRIKRKNKTTEKLVEAEEKRTLGLIILRGQEVVAAVMDGPPPGDPSARLGQEKPTGAVVAATAAATGIARPAGRGAGVGLQGPAAGVGGPGFGGFPPQAGFSGGAPGQFPPGAGGFGRGGFQPPPQAFSPQGFAPPGGRGFQPPGGFPGR